jgi:hypothetical protein
MAGFYPWDGLAFYSTTDHYDSLIASLSKHPRSVGEKDR